MNAARQSLRHHAQRKKNMLAKSASKRKDGKGKRRAEISRANAKLHK